MMNPEIERRDNSRGWMAWLIVTALVLTAMLYLYYWYPELGIGPQQPIYFSHRVHAGVKEINCRFCHPYVERSVHAGLPEVSKCFFCHTYIIPQHPQIVKEREHLDSGNPMQWVRLFYLPDYVKFNHERHIRRKFDCSTCHGDVKTRDRLERVEFQMEFCVSCHRENKAQLDCWLACHN
jgi:hypothetical protein